MPLKEKILRNRVVVALYICGFSQREIATAVGSDKRNVQMFIKKYFPRYGKEIYEKIKQPTKLRRK